MLKRIPGAADVVADPVRGKGYIEVRARPRAGRAAGRERRRGQRRGRDGPGRHGRHDGRRGPRAAPGPRPLRARLPRGRGVGPRPAGAGRRAPGRRPARLVPLAEVADVRVVEGRPTIKSENGLLRNYVRLNVRGRDAVDFVDEARRVVAERVELPEGVFVEWTGQFEHEVRAAPDARRRRAGRAGADLRGPLLRPTATWPTPS